MTIRDAITESFKVTAAVTGYQGKWMPSAAWYDAIKRETGKEYNARSITSALKYICESGGAKVESQGTTFRIAYHVHQITKRDGTVVPQCNFFYVYSGPERRITIPTKNNDWQKFYNRSTKQYVPKRTDTRNLKRELDDARVTEKKPKVGPTDEEVASNLKMIDEWNNQKPPATIEDAEGSMILSENDVLPTSEREQEAMLREAWGRSYPNMPFPDQLLNKSASSNEAAQVSDNESSPKK